MKAVWEVMVLTAQAVTAAVLIAVKAVTVDQVVIQTTQLEVAVVRAVNLLTGQAAREGMVAHQSMAQAVTAVTAVSQLVEAAVKAVRVDFRTMYRAV